jgi:hypothetical protein
VGADALDRLEARRELGLVLFAEREEVVDAHAAAAAEVREVAEEAAELTAGGTGLRPAIVLQRCSTVLHTPTS